MDVFHSMCTIIFKEAVGDTLEQLWMSYNLVEKLRGIATLRKLKVCVHLDTVYSH